MEKTVIVTGASKGIGREIARCLATKGYTVIANYNKSIEEMNDLKEELNCKGIFLDIFQADISNKSDSTRLVDYAINKYGKIDILINNAGISQIKEFTQITEKDWDTMIKTNLYSVFFMTQAVCKNMIHNKKGCIINISSIWGSIGGSCEVHYSVSKAGIDAMTKSLAKELGPSNIRVNSIAPGIINTTMNSHLSEEELNDIKEEIPLERIGKTNDIEKCVEWLIEDEYTTGQVISINGGWGIF